MLRQFFRPACSCLGSLVVAVALVLVPTVTRARQHLCLHETTRLSIRLNWQSDAPPRMHLVAGGARGHAALVPRVFVIPPPISRFLSRAPAFDEPVVRPLLDNSPDLLRGPPVLFSPGVGARKDRDIDSWK
jgi:hypothetical protein